MHAFANGPDGHQSTVTGFAAREQVDTFAAFAWLFKDQLVAAVEREVDAVADDKHALTDEQRAQRLREQLLAGRPVE